MVKYNVNDKVLLAKGAPGVVVQVKGAHRGYVVRLFNQYHSDGAPILVKCDHTDLVPLTPAAEALFRVKPRF